MNPEIEIVDGNDWMNGTTMWRVTYEYANARGGGHSVDYFKTSNRYTPPTGPQIRKCLDGDEMLVIGIESIEWFTTDTPNEQPSLEPGAPEDARHNTLFDLIGDKAEPEESHGVVGYDPSTETEADDPNEAT